MVCLFTVRAQANLRFMVASYNVENLFDNIHDEGKDDQEYTPNGKENWTDERLNLKLEQVAAEIRAIGNGKGPDIITLPETENIRVLNMLNKKLADLKYTAVLVEGPDKRGIDVGLLTRFPLARQPHMFPVAIPGDRPTRPVYDIVLQITPKVKMGLLMNHWPSRMAPPLFRCDAGKVLRKAFQLHLAKDNDLDYIATGDFNDEPEDPSLATCLGTGDAQKVMASTAADPVFFNLYSEKNLPKDQRGTYFFSKTNEWNAIDHIVLARGLFDNKNIRYVPGSFGSVRTLGLNVLPTPTKMPGGYTTPAGAPVGFVTVGDVGKLKAFGVSDHLPVRALFEVVQ